MIFTDAAPLSGVRRTRDGYLSAEIRSARTGIQHYLGRELGRPDLERVAVYRAPEEVFHADAMASMAHRPVVIEHPDQPVTADNWRDLAVGMTGDVIAREGGYVRVPMALMDGEAIKIVDAGKREVSWGYSCELVWEDGVTPEGEKYQARQVGIRANHLAVTDRGRAGSACRIGDRETWGDAPPISTVKGKRMADTILRTITHDGVPVETTDAGAAVISKLEGLLADSRKALNDAQTAHQTALAAKDADLAKKDAEIDDLKGKQLDAAALDKLVAGRANLIATAKAIAADVKTDGLSDDEIRKAVVVAKVGDAAVKDKSADYINARFDILAEGAGKSGADPMRDAINRTANDKPVTADVAYTGMVRGLTDAWKGEQAKGAA